MQRLILSIIFVAIVAMIACGWDSTKEPPQMIEADGQSYVACGTDSVYIFNEGSSFGETTFRVKFTDANALSHVIKGIHKLHVSDIPKSAKVCNGGGPLPLRGDDGNDLYQQYLNRTKK